ncbi:MAG: DUF1847 domain-containing protein [Deltaproteobacteria bacterium]|nr:DUF1847 domain-containing protein [Deltaproteobacteria bacterium]MBN2670354.1 DUF1847 domain-containing protein [Deltaproteobacteria bacterium]
MTQLKATQPLTPCRTCKNMVCRTRSTDCHGVHDESLAAYHEDVHTGETALAASALVDDGRAGALNRAEEVIEFCRTRDYTSIGVAYCFGMKTLAMEFCDMLENAGFQTAPVSCTSGAVKEREIDVRKETETVSCNPAGQAMVLNRKKLDLVVEIGLCLGHDIIFHKLIEHPHTVLVVKDRTSFHNPSAAFSSYQDGAADFITSLDNSFAMKSPEWLAEQMNFDEALTVIDLRGAEAVAKARIPGSVHIPLKQLPQLHTRLDREHKIVCVCNGSVQSAYAIMFLHTRGFKQVFNLSGGFSRWQKEAFPTVGTE